MRFMKKKGLGILVSVMLVGGFVFATQYDCATCNGTGETMCRSCHGTGEKTCLSCGGSGKVMVQNPNFRIDNGQPVMIKEDCSNCGGSRRVSCSNCNGGSVRCRSCNGRGYFYE